MGKWVTGVLLALCLGGLVYFTVSKELPQIGQLSGQMTAASKQMYYLAGQKKNSSIIYRINQKGLISHVFLEKKENETGIIEGMTYQNGLYYLKKEKKDSDEIEDAEKKEETEKELYGLYRIADQAKQSELATKLELKAEESVADLLAEKNHFYITCISEDRKAAFVYQFEVDSEDKKIELAYEGYMEGDSYLTDAAYADGRLYVLTNQGSLFYYEGGRQYPYREKEESCISWIKGSGQGLIGMDFCKNKLFAAKNQEDIVIEEAGFFESGDISPDKDTILLKQDAKSSIFIKTNEDQDWKHIGKLRCTFPVWVSITGGIVFLDIVFVFTAGFVIFLTIKQMKKRKTVRKKILGGFVFSTVTVTAVFFVFMLLYTGNHLLRERKGFASCCAEGVLKALSSVELTETDISSFYQTPLFSEACQVLERNKGEKYPVEHLLVCSGTDGVYQIASRDYAFGYGLSGILPVKMQQTVQQAGNEGMAQSVVLDWNFEKWLFLVTPADNRITPMVFLITGVSLEDLKTGLIGQLWKFFLLEGSCILISVLVGAATAHHYVKPLRTLSEELKMAENGKLEAFKGELPEEEFKRIRNHLTKLYSTVKRQRYMESDVLNACIRFIPQGIERLMKKHLLSEIMAGDMSFVTGTLAVVLTEEPGVIGDSKIGSTYLNLMNRLYTVIEQKNEENNGILLTNDSNLSCLRLIYPQSAEDAYFFGTDTIRETDEEGKEGLPQPFMMLHYGTYAFGLAGTENRAFPFVHSKELELLDCYSYKLKKQGIRMVITEETKNRLKQPAICRYIGYILSKSEALSFRLYEVLEVYEEEERQLKIRTNRKFQKGLKLFYQSDFYLARSSFAEVLKESPKDAVAKWYLFRCERLFQFGGKDEAVFQLFAE